MLIFSWTIPVQSKIFCQKTNLYFVDAVLLVYVDPTSRYLLLSHGLDHRFRLLHSNRQTVINITHGMYFKRMHKLLRSLYTNTEVSLRLKRLSVVLPHTCEYVWVNQSVYHRIKSSQSQHLNFQS